MGAVACAIALGSNLGDSRQVLEDAIVALDATNGIRVTARSRWYCTKPVGPPQPDYVNGCAILQVTLDPEALLQALLVLEKKFNRIRQGLNQPRTLDLDLLLFDGLILNLPHLTIPHPRMASRAFVLVPLAEIAADWIEPTSGLSIGQLLQLVDCSGILGTVP
jgi:2-amino-4-hydroxy-6-hydroxymethyldihydropteridine diphosphokinase